MRFWTSGPHRSPAESDVVISRMLAGPERAWVLCLSAEAEAVGLIHYLGNDGAPGMGYLLHSDYWGHGYMDEAARAVLAHGFDELGFDRVELWIDSRNLRSRRLADRLGFVCRSAFPMKYPRDRQSHEKLVYGLTVAEWSSGRIDREVLPIRPYGLQPVLGVPDVAATAAWYADNLKFRTTFLFGDPPSYGGVVFSEWTATGAQIHLRRVEVSPNVENISLYIETGPGIEQLHASYRERDVTILTPPTPRPWGALEFEIRDCNGYRLCFSTPC